MRQCRADRVEHAKRLRALLADLGLTHSDAAKLLHVSLRTLQNWLSARHEVPYVAYKLLRLLRFMELPGQSWAGWHFSRGHLVTPEGRTISGKDGSWWSLLVRQAHGFSQLYRENLALKAGREAAAPTPEGTRLGGDAGDGAKGLAGPVAGCYAEPCLRENSTRPDSAARAAPVGNHGDNRTITGPIWGQSDTIPESWPLISDSLLPLTASPATTASGSESALIPSSASHLTPIYDNPAQTLPPRLSSLPFRLRPSLPLRPGQPSESSPSLPLHPFHKTSPTPSPSLGRARQRLSAPSSPLGISATGSLDAQGVAS